MDAEQLREAVEEASLNPFPSVLRGDSYACPAVESGDWTTCTCARDW